MQRTVTIEPYRFAASWVVGARTYFMDRFVPQVELIRRPGGHYAGGTLTLIANESATTARSSKPHRANRLRYALGGDAPVERPGRLIDLRFEPYFNISHQLNSYLPLCLTLRETFVPGDEPVTIVVHERMPAAMRDIYRAVGFEVLATDGSVRGRRLRWTIDTIDITLSHQHIVFAAHRELIERAFPPVPGLPGKIYLSRRGTRTLTNEAEILPLLEARGYTRVFMEDHTGLEQMALLRQASDIVAIHGAALAPLPYRDPARPFTFVELCPVGHMTNLFQIMSDQIGGRYVGVRGRVKPGDVAGAYGTTPFLSASLDGFEVDPHSLAVAFSILDRGGEIIDDYPDRWGV